MKIFGCFAAKDAFEEGEVCLRQITDCFDAHCPELFCGFPAAAEEVADRQRPELFPDFLRIERVDLIGLCEVTGAFCEDLVRGNADVDCEA